MLPLFPPPVFWFFDCFAPHINRISARDLCCCCSLCSTLKHKPSFFRQPLRVYYFPFIKSKHFGFVVLSACVFQTSNILNSVWLIIVFVPCLMLSFMSFVRAFCFACSCSLNALPLCAKAVYVQFYAMLMHIL